MQVLEGEIWIYFWRGITNTTNQADLVINPFKYSHRWAERCTPCKLMDVF